MQQPLSEEDKIKNAHKMLANLIKQKKKQDSQQDAANPLARLFA